MIWDITGFDSESFIRDFWQKKPCVIRQAFVDIESPISPEELAGLACEDDVHSRLILENQGDAPWQLRYGPFTEKDFTTLPDSHYSLLVSECEKWIPEIADLIGAFDFVPNWRIDDAMISYAPPGGSVGPHVDEYDVFLLQLQGERNWQYDENRMNDPTLIPDLDLAILESFNAEHETVLDPGDMLYLPPGVAHHGVAVNACLTCSIGFRAPTAVETLESLTFEIDKQERGLARYSDANLEIKRHPAEITHAEIDRFKQLVLKLFDEPGQIWIDAVGKLLSDAVINKEEHNQNYNSIDQLQIYNWAINPDTRMLYYRKDSEVRFYFNGQLAVLPASDEIVLFIQKLCSAGQLDKQMVNFTKTRPLLAELLVNMANVFAIVPIEN